MNVKTVHSREQWANRHDCMGIWRMSRVSYAGHMTAVRMAALLPNTAYTLYKQQNNTPGWFLLLRLNFENL
ncbi:MAG: hypothetical protein HFH60_12645 [Lachnospiraceae bacterium]|nr:hypothetical protein [Lachnospiraceae bacterium]